LAPCCFCGEDVRFNCRDTGRHTHDPKLEAVEHGYCFPCQKVVLLAVNSDEKVCSECGFGWGPYVARNQEDPEVVICNFCGAMQQLTAQPSHCGRCTMPLRIPGRIGWRM
jgi:hypothetical protein